MMFKKQILFLFFLLFFGPLVLAQSILTGKVVAVSDGDTFTLLIEGNRQIKVRLHGIDCPEKSQDFGSRAKQFTSDAIFSSVIKVKVKTTDRYGRTIGIAMQSNGVVLNEALLSAGLAWHYKQYDNSQEYAALEEQARLNQLGLWSMPNPVAPWDFRRSKKNSSTSTSLRVTPAVYKSSASITLSL